MTEPAAAGDPSRRGRPGQRPRWVVVLALGMLVFGGHLLTIGVDVLTAHPRPTATATDATPDLQGIAALVSATADAHPIAVRVNALSKVLLGLLLLFAVAAVFASDPRARAATLLAAWVGIGYHLGDGLFHVLVVRPGVVDAAPLLASLVASQRPGSTPLSGQDMVSLHDAVIAATGLVGVAFCVLLLAFFGGRRGRGFFGGGGQPSHGHEQRS
jgi:hypothetical protein